MGSNIVVGGGHRGGNMVVGGQRGCNVVVGGGQRGGNMVVGGGQRGGNMVVGGQRGCNMVVGGGQRRGNSIGGSKRSNNIGGSIGWDSVVDKSWVSLSISLTLDNVLNGTVLGNIRWSVDTVGHSSVVGGAVVASDGVAGKGTDNWGNNVVVVVSGQRGSNSSDNGGGNMAEMAISSIGGGSIRAIDEGRVSLSFSLTLGNDVSVVKPVGERSDKRGGGIGGQRGGGICVQGGGGIGGQGGGGIAGQRGGSMVVGGQGKVMSVRVGTIGTISTIVTIGGDILSISSGFRLSHGSGGKSENYKHLHVAGGCFETFQGGLSH